MDLLLNSTLSFLFGEGFDPAMLLYGLEMEQLNVSSNSYP